MSGMRIVLYAAGGPAAGQAHVGGACTRPRGDAGSILGTWISDPRGENHTSSSTGWLPGLDPKLVGIPAVSSTCTSRLRCTNLQFWAVLLSQQNVLYVEFVVRESAYKLDRICQCNSRKSEFAALADMLY
eukprot:COSAG02_NODE_4340_length_5485_cov_2.496101_2_plen_130_part_00